MMTGFFLGFFKHREHHFELLQILENELGDIVFRSNESGLSYDYTINSIRQTGKTLLITYHNEFIARGKNFFFFHYHISLGIKKFLAFIVYLFLFSVERKHSQSFSKFCNFFIIPEFLNIIV